MKNLENFGVQEMNAHEFLEVDGGNWFTDLVHGTPAVIYSVYQTASGYAEAWLAGFQAGNKEV